MKNTAHSPRKSRPATTLRSNNLNILPKVILAPLAGCSDLSFRLICREHGAALAFYEMVDCNSLIYAPDKDKDILLTHTKDKPIAGQLLGSEPDAMAAAARIMLEKVKISFLDINSACPVPKVVKKIAGARLLTEPKKLYAIIRALVKALDIPITVKLRVGYDSYDEKHMVDIAKNCQKSGVAALFVHGRTRKQMYKGGISYEALKAIKHAVKIPVYASGNIFTPENAKEMLELTDCDGVMVARGAFGNPWIFDQIDQYLKTGKYDKDIPISERIAVLKRHLSYIEKYKKIKESSKMGNMRKVALWYIKGIRGAARIRENICRIKSYEELNNLIDGLSLS